MENTQHKADIHELHDLADEAYKKFNVLRAEMEAHLPPPGRVKEAFANALTAVQAIRSATDLKKASFEPKAAEKPGEGETVPA